MVPTYYQTIQIMASGTFKTIMPPKQRGPLFEKSGAKTSV